MKIGVIVSTYNRPDALLKVLNGLVAQTRMPDEIIVADDGSGAETREMLSPFLEMPGSRISHAWHPDEGFRLAGIRNLAIRKSRSDYLVFLDGDCIPDQRFVYDHEEMACPGFFFQGKRVLVGEKAARKFSFEDTLKKWRLAKMAVSGQISNSHHVVRVPVLPAFTTTKLSGVRGCNMGFFRDDLIAVNGFNQDFKGWGREDSEIVVRMYKYGLKRREHPFRAICYHLWHPENERAGLGKNDQLLEQAISGNGYRCSAGITENG